MRRRAPANVIPRPPLVVLSLVLVVGGGAGCTDDGAPDLHGAAVCSAQVRDYDRLDSDAPFLQHSPEEAGANCPAGGQRLERGTDRDQSDSLEGDEISQTGYICDERRFPHAGAAGLYRLDETFCPTTDSVLAAITPAAKITAPRLIISPHAGWQYSGIATASALACVDVFELVIILGNNHFNNGGPFAVYNNGSWAIPTGDVPVDERVAAQLIADVELLRADKAAHSMEHSIEVQLMWLHRFQPALRVVPIAINKTNDYDALAALAGQLAESLQRLDRPYLVLATTDLSHFDPADVAKRKDDQMVAEMLALDPRGLFDLVSPQRAAMNMCGLEPTVVGMIVAQRLGAHSAELVERLDSSARSGDRQRVVGYASIVLH